MVRADAHRPAKVLAQHDKRREFLADALQLFGVLRVAVFADFEFFLIDVISWIHPDFFHPLGGFERGVGLEMNIGDEWHLAASGTHFAGNVFQVRRVNSRLRGDADDFAAGLSESEHFGDAGRRVAGVGSDHRLHTDRVMGTDTDISDHHLAGQTAGVVEQVWTIAQGSGRSHFE